MVWPLLVIAGLVLYFMNADERARLAQRLISLLRQAQEGAVRIRPGPEPLHDTLRARTPWALATPALVTLHLIVFAAMVLEPGPLGDPNTLEQFGGNFAPRTTNGEWGRLVTSTFVHGGVVHLVVNLGALLSVGLLLERLVGPLTFLAIYIGAGALGGLVSLASEPMSISVGASAAVFGLYGLLLASWAYGTVQNATTTVRLVTVKRLAPVAVVFITYNLASDSISTAAECAGIVAGFTGGLLLGRHVRHRRPPAREVGVMMATTAVICMVTAAPLAGIADMRPALAEVVAIEKRTVLEYDAAVEEFRQGRLTAKTLVALIDERILPVFRESQALLDGPRKLPPDQLSRVAAAETYLRLRHESWRMRAAALRKGSTAMLRDADAAETAALAALTIVSSERD